MSLGTLKIGVMNDKGGVGKTAITQQLAQGFGLQAVDLDPYGNLSTRIPNTLEIEQGEDLNQLPSAFIADFGGFAHEDEDSVLDMLDIIVIPYIPTAESVETTYMMVQRISATITPILFVANRVVKNKDEEAIKKSFVLFSSLLEYGANLATIQDSRAITTAINGSFSVIKKSKERGLVGHQFKKIANSFINLEKKILKTIEGEIIDV